MKGVLRRAGRAAAMLVLLTLVAQSAIAADRDGGRDRGFMDQIKRAKHWIIRAFDQIGLPPG